MIISSLNGQAFWRFFFPINNKVIGIFGAERRFLFSCERARTFSHGVSAVELDSESVVNDAVEDSISDGWIGNVAMPVCDWELRGEYAGEFSEPVIEKI